MLLMPCGAMAQRIKRSNSREAAEGVGRAACRPRSKLKLALRSPELLSSLSPSSQSSFIQGGHIFPSSAGKQQPIGSEFRPREIKVPALPPRHSTIYHLRVIDLFWGPLPAVLSSRASSHKA